MPSVRSKKDKAFLKKVSDRSWVVQWEDPAVQTPHFVVDDQFKIDISASGRKIKDIQHGIKNSNGQLRWHSIKPHSSSFSRSWFQYDDTLFIHFYFGKRGHRHEMIMSFDYSDPNAPVFEYHADSAALRSNHGRGGGN